MRLAHLNGLRAVEAVLRLGSFRAAAEEVGITPAALGQRIRALEESLGQTLFHRHPAGPVPTETARAAAARLSDGMKALSGAYATLEHGRHESRLWLTSTQAMAENWLPARLPDFLREVGSVDLRLESSPRLVDFATGDFDFGIRFSAEPGSEMGSVRLMPGSIAPVCTRAFAERYDLSAETRDITGVPVCNITAPNSDPDWVSDWSGWCRANGVERRDAQSADPHFSHFATGLRMATSGLSMMLCGLLSSFRSLKSGDLVLPFGPESVMWTRYSSWLVWSADRRLSPLQVRFRDWLVAESEAFNAELDAWLASGD